MDTIETFENFLNNKNSKELTEAVKKGKTSFSLPSVGNDKPGLSLYNKNINGVDMALVDISTFYLDRSVYDEKILKDLRDGFTEVWKKVTSKY